MKDKYKVLVIITHREEVVIEAESGEQAREEALASVKATSDNFWGSRAEIVESQK